MRYCSKIMVVAFVLLFSVSMFVGCGAKDTPQNSVPDSGVSSSVDADVALLDGATLLGANGEYYESGALNITSGNKYVFKLVNNASGNRDMSTLYMYNARRRMGNRFLDGRLEDQAYDGAYWVLKVYDANKNPMQFYQLHPLTSQLCYSDSWDSAFEFANGSTYYFVVDIIGDATGSYYFSVY